MFAHSGRRTDHLIGWFTIDGRCYRLSRAERRLVRCYHRAVARHVKGAAARRLTAELAARYDRRAVAE